MDPLLAAAGGSFMETSPMGTPLCSTASVSSLYKRSAQSRDPSEISSGMGRFAPRGSTRVSVAVMAARFSLSYSVLLSCSSSGETVSRWVYRIREIASMTNFRSIWLWYNPVISLRVRLWHNELRRARAPTLVMSFSPIPSFSSVEFDSIIRARWRHPSSPIPFQPRYISVSWVLSAFNRNPSAMDWTPSSWMKFPSRLKSRRLVFLEKKVPSSTSQISLWAKLTIWMESSFSAAAGLSRKAWRTEDAPRLPIWFFETSSSRRVVVVWKKGHKPTTPRFPILLDRRERRTRETGDRFPLPVPLFCLISPFPMTSISLSLSLQFSRMSVCSKVATLSALTSSRTWTWCNRVWLRSNRRVWWLLLLLLLLLP
mmetsp:Transcript_43393/g.90356  ORF Transcript_43393/g.90356 Transcript_43393/m.90356 type:complete len:370 (+) Transcript_43393:3366-4475(+)